MARTTVTAVKNLLQTGGDYRTGKDLTVFIDSASILIDRAVVYGASLDPVVTGTAAELEITERWLAAHMYQQADAGYSSRSTDGASGSFRGTTGKYLEASLYGQTAIKMDPTGYLTSIATEASASSTPPTPVGGVWLGTPGYAQRSYDDRN